MSEIQRAHPTEIVDVVVDVDNGDGLAVVFAITTLDGEAHDSITATVRSGVARARWKADAKDKALPLELVFTASLGESSVKAKSLILGPPGTISTPAWLLLAETGGTPGALTVLEPTDTLVIDQNPASRAPYRSFHPGENVGLLVDVKAPDGGPLKGTVDLVFDLQKATNEAATEYKSVKKYTRSVDGGAGVTQVAAKWAWDTMGETAPYYFRFVVQWARRPGEDATPEDQKTPKTSVPA